jgi:type III secretion protein W
MPQLNFEVMAKQFMDLCNERYPTSDKVLQIGDRLAELVIAPTKRKMIEAKIIIISQFRDAVRKVALNQNYRSVQHRDELFSAILDALEELEDQLEEEIQKEEDAAGGEEDEENFVT